ncbi:hypothetical protein E2562_031468, partial [Oryza meyeriana var. granulata]
HPEGKRKMDQHHVQQQQQQYVDPYRTMVLSPQPDHLNALQYNHQQQPQPPPQATPPPPPHHHASLASHFHLLHLMTRLADAIGKGTRDQNSDALVEDLTSQFARCQQLLNSISGTLSSKSTIENSSLTRLMELDRFICLAIFPSLSSMHERVAAPCVTNVAT